MLSRTHHHPSGVLLPVDEMVDSLRTLRIEMGNALRILRIEMAGDLHIPRVDETAGALRIPRTDETVDGPRTDEMAHYSLRILHILRADEMGDALRILLIEMAEALHTLPVDEMADALRILIRGDEMEDAHHSRFLRDKMTAADVEDSLIFFSHRHRRICFC